MYKFETVTVKLTDNGFKNIKAEEVFEVRKRSIAEFVQEFEKRLYCPECREARLSVVNRKSAVYLRTFKSDKHGDKCSMEVPQIEKRVLENIIEHVNIKELDAASLLDDVIKLLLCGKKVNDNPLIVSVDEVNNQTHITRSSVSTKPRTHRSLPRKLITLLNDKALNCYKVFYGDVNVKFVSNEYNGYYLRLYPLDNSNGAGHFICSILISEKVVPYLDSNLFASVPYKAHFAAIMKLNKDGGYIKATLEHSTCLRIERF